MNIQSLKLKKLKKNVLYRDYYNLDIFKTNQFDLIIAFNSIYMQNLGDVIKTLEQITRVSKKSYISLASCYSKKR